MHNIQILVRLGFFICFLSFIATSSTAQTANDWVHVRLMDRLDRPDDGYCLDILGNRLNLRIDLPLFAHNCKSGPTADSVLVHTDEGHLVFPAARVCVTAFGVNRTVLPGTSVLLRTCNEQTAFFNADTLQKFDYTANGQFKLRGYALCLTVGEQSSSTYSAHDRWRVLYLESCESAPLSHSAWEMVALN